MVGAQLHEAHVRVLRCKRAAPWLAARPVDFRLEYLGKVKRKRGVWEWELLKYELDLILSPRRQHFASRMDEVRRAVFG